MEDLISLVLAFIFIVLPMIEGLKKKRKRQSGPPVPHRDPMRLPSPDGLEPTLPAERATASAGQSSWSDGWGSWPGEELEDEEEEADSEPVPSWTPADGREWSRRSDGTLERSSAPAEVTTRTPDLVVPPESAQATELQRLQEMANRVDRLALTETRPAAPTTRVPAQAVILQPTVRRPAWRATALLNDRMGVRRALIVSEILGPPLSMRDRPVV